MEVRKTIGALIVGMLGGKYEMIKLKGKKLFDYLSILKVLLFQSGCKLESS